MKKTVVIYESKYGFTRQYAQWIGEDLACPVFSRKEFSPRTFSEYETIVFGGGLYAGGVGGIRLLTDNWQQLSSRKVILFTCGLADPKDPANVRHIRESLEKILSPEMYRNIHFFHLQGGIDYDRLSLVHRSMMAILRRMLQKKDPEELTAEDQQLLDTYGQKLNFTDRQNIARLVQYVQQLND